MAINMQNGLFGLGGFGGGMPEMPQQMAGLYDPQAARRGKLKSVLTQTGLAMLGQGPSAMPINFGTSLGQGLMAGVKAGDETENQYRDMAYQTFKINQDAENQKYGRQRDAKEDDWRRTQFEYGQKRDGINDSWNMQQRNRQLQEWQQADAKKKQWDEFVSTLPPDQRELARLYPEKYAQQSLEQQFNTQGGGVNGVYGNVYWSPDGKPYGLNKDGSGMKLLPVEGGASIVDPAQMAGNKIDAKGMADARVTYRSMTSKMPGLELVVSKLENLADKATYSLAGQGRDFIAAQSGYGDTEGSIARKEYVSTVDNQVLPMLRDTFGAAFTVAEGETLRNTLGDPNIPPESKKAVLRSFIEQKRRDIEALAVEGGISTTPAPVAAPQGSGWQIEEVP